MDITQNKVLIKWATSFYDPYKHETDYKRVKFWAGKQTIIKNINHFVAWTVLTHSDVSHLKKILWLDSLLQQLHFINTTQWLKWNYTKKITNGFTFRNILFILHMFKMLCMAWFKISDVGTTDSTAQAASGENG